MKGYMYVTCALAATAAMYASDAEASWARSASASSAPPLPCSGSR